MPRVVCNQTPLYINAGGGTTVDSIARTFAADQYFTAGSVGTSTYDFGNAIDDALFDSSRHGLVVSLHAPLPDGHYSVWLEFADAQSTAAGQRVMNVAAEGQPVASALDVFAAAGAATPFAKQFDVNVADGALDVSLTATRGDAFVNALVAVPTDIPTLSQPDSWEGLSDAGRQVTTESNLRQIGQNILLYSNENKGKYPPDLLTMFQHERPPMSVLGDPRTDTQLPRGELSALEQSAWVGARSDYIYVGTGSRNSGPPNAVIAYENPQRVSGSIAILYGDGHVALVDRATAATQAGFDPNIAVTGGPPIVSSQPSDPLISQARSNLSNIAQSLLLYSNEQRGNLPPTLGELAYIKNVDPAWFVDPRGLTPTPPSGLSSDAAHDYINSLSDYVYLGAGKNNSLAATAVVMYEQPSTNADGIVLLFADGSTQYEETRFAMETLRRSTQSYPSTTPLAQIAKPTATIAGATSTLYAAGVPATELISGTKSSPAIASYQWDLHYDGNPADFHATSTAANAQFLAPTTAGNYRVATRVVDATGAVSSIASTSIAVLPIVVSHGADYSLTNSGFALNTGTASVSGDLGAWVPGISVIASGTSRITFAATEHLSRLQLNDSAVAAMSTDGNRVLAMTDLSLATTASLDLSNNTLIVDYAGNSPAPTIAGYLQSGRSGGAWNGTSGITSSAVAGTPNTALGYGEASAIVGPNGGRFANQTVDSTALIVRFTYLGDANLDRKVDVGDLGMLATNWQRTGANWAQGDFDYSGRVDIGDLGLLSTDWQKIYTPPATSAVKTVVSVAATAPFAGKKIVSVS